MMRIEQRPLAEIAAGTPVAADVADTQGGLLLKAGSVVTERAIKQLTQRGITSLPVEVTDEATPEEREARSAALEVQLTDLFSAVREQPLMEQLYQLVLCYRRDGL